MTVASRGGLGTGESLQVLCVLGMGEGLTGCDDGQHGRTGHGRVPAGPPKPDVFQKIKTSLRHFKTYIIVKLFKQDETKYLKN